MLSIAWMQYNDYRQYLTEEYERRKQLNAAYSLRAFARDLGLSAPRLSQVLSQRYGLSVQAATEVAKKLRLNPEEVQWFCDSVGSLHSRSVKERIELNHRINEYKKTKSKIPELQLEYFKVISDWYHFAILELTHLSDFKNNTKWIAKKLNITVDDVKLAIKRLVDLDLLEEKNGTLVDVFKILSTPNDIPSDSLKKFNLQLIKKAMEAVYHQEVQTREITSLVFAIDDEKIPYYKEKIRQLKSELSAEAEKSKNKNQVYCLSLQLFNLTN